MKCKTIIGALIANIVNVYNLFIIWNVKPAMVLSFDKYNCVYNLFIIWNVKKEVSALVLDCWTSL